MMEADKFISIVFQLGLVVALLVLTFIGIVIYYRLRRNVHVKESIQKEEEYRQSLTTSRLEVQEATFSTLGKELHDNIGQLLSTTKMLIGITERSLENPPETLLNANETLGKAISDLRDLSKSLNNEWLEQFDLVQNLSAEARRINSANTVQIKFVHPETISLKPDDQIMLFRIIQEAIQNAIKHGAPNHININLREDNNWLETIIHDDGLGFAENYQPSGVGIMNMKQRARLLGGSIEWKGGDGCTVIAKTRIKE
jgi:signal transduction histidine kinase